MVVPKPIVAVLYYVVGFGIVLGTIFAWTMALGMVAMLVWTLT